MLALSVGPLYLALGFAPTEVADGGLVAPAGGDAALALATTTGSLVVSALAGPLLFAALLQGPALATGGTAPVARFFLVVIIPLLAGFVARLLVRGLSHLEGESGAATPLPSSRLCTLRLAA